VKVKHTRARGLELGRKTRAEAKRRERDERRRAKRARRGAAILSTITEARSEAAAT
jgi:hypothetical protein